MDRHIRFLLGLASLAIVLACHGVFGPDGGMQLAELRKYERTLGARAFTLLEGNEDLREQIVRLRNDDHYLETIARIRLGLVGANEIVYRFERERSGAPFLAAAARRPGSRAGPVGEPTEKARVPAPR